MPDDAFHRLADTIRCCTAVVHREFHEYEVRFVPEHILFQTERAEFGSGSADGRMNLVDSAVRIEFAEIVQTLRTPSVLSRDTAAEIGDPDRLSAFKSLIEIGESATDIKFDRFADFHFAEVFHRGCRTNAGRGKQQSCQSGKHDSFHRKSFLLL